MCARLVGLAWVGPRRPQPRSLGFFSLHLLSLTTMEVKRTESEIEVDKKPSNQHVSVVECIKSILSCSAIVEWDCLRSVRHKVLSTGHWEKIIVFFSFLISGCKKSWYCDIFSGWIRRSPYSAESIEERYETLLRSFSSF